MVGAAAAGGALAWGVREFARVVGTFSVATSHPTASKPEILDNLKYLAPWGANMLGVGSGAYGSGNVPGVLATVHVVGLVVVVAGVTTATVGLFAWCGAAPSPGPVAYEGGDRRLDDLLVLAFFADLGVFIFLTAANDSGYMRYLTSAVIFGAILGARWVGRATTAITSRRVRWWGAAVGLTVVAAFGGAFGITVSAALPIRQFSQLGAFLEAHQLRNGIGDYWSASITTVATDGAVTVRPVITTPTGKVVRYERQSDASWYANQRFTFLVYDTARPWGGIDASTASATFGPVQRTYVVGPYRVLVWSHAVSVPVPGFSPVPVKATGTMPTTKPSER